ncbi:hypothetical protein DLAC_07655 [Tieghemostelium lacteum]|uniref:DH domain-containing protein n=1 Tax=Tieghemostelium lacteum TaxID=361077 RepID=A0A151ZD33_TIELA|nr:hypothetical protein DLAC_07655 [Tieghemostelium lacteum]|eukprot:KYQ91850.1 hypothetical protein DLAC_07655 [Tieghemostelium lacteum]
MSTEPTKFGGVPLPFFKTQSKGGTILKPIPSSTTPDTDKKQSNTTTTHQQAQSPSDDPNSNQEELKKKRKFSIKTLKRDSSSKKEQSEFAISAPVFKSSTSLQIQDGEIISNHINHEGEQTPLSPPQQNLTHLAKIALGNSPPLLNVNGTQTHNNNNNNNNNHNNLIKPTSPPSSNPITPERISPRPPVPKKTYESSSINNSPNQSTATSPTITTNQKPPIQKPPVPKKTYDTSSINNTQNDNQTTVFKGRERSQSTPNKVEQTHTNSSGVTSPPVPARLSLKTQPVSNSHTNSSGMTSPPIIPPRNRSPSTSNSNIPTYNNHNSNNSYNNTLVISPMNLTPSPSNTSPSNISPPLRSFQTKHSASSVPIVNQTDDDSNNTLNNSNESNSSDQRKKTMRMQLLTRKSATFNLSSDTVNVDEDEDTYSQDLDDDSSNTTTSSSNNDGSNMELVDVVEQDLDSSNNSAGSGHNTIGKKKSFFGGNNKSKETLDQIREMVDRLSVDVKIESRRSQLPKFDQIKQISNRVIVEIIETEADYLEDLEIIISLYQSAMNSEIIKSNTKVTDTEVQTVFSNVQDIYNLNDRFYQMLLQIIPEIQKDQDYPNIEDIFFRNANDFQLYSIYLSNQESSIKLLKQWENNSLVNNCLQMIKLLPSSKNLGISSYLIKPVQRLCKYPLLLRELKKSVPEENPHHRAYERSAKLMESIVSAINGKIAMEEKINSLIQTMGKEYENILISKILIKEGKMKVLNEETNNIKEIMAYLLEDKLIFHSKGKFKKKVIVLYFEKILNIQNKENLVQNGIDITYMVGEIEQAFKLILSCESYSSKLLWIQEIEDSIHADKIRKGKFTSSY